MRRRMLGLLLAGLTAAPLAAVAGPNPAPSDTPTRHQFHGSYTSERGRLGIALIGITDELRAHYGAPTDRGLLVGRVIRDSAAARAGLHVGDVITSVGARPTHDAGDVLAVIEHAAKGDKVNIDIVRDGKALQLEATLTDDPIAGAATFDSAVPDMQSMWRDMMKDMPAWMSPWSDTPAPPAGHST